MQPGTRRDAAAAVGEAGRGIRQPRPTDLHAAAGVDDEADGDRRLLVREEIDGARRPVLEQAKGIARQPFDVGAAAIADGWLPLYYSPFHEHVYADSLAGAKDDFDIVAGVQLNITDSVEEGLAPVKMMLGFYIGGMGAKGQNYHTKLMERFGYEKEALQIQEAFFAGRRDEAIALVPDDFADAISLVGPPERIRDRLAAWDESAVSTLLVYSPGSVEKLDQIASLVLG